MKRTQDAAPAGAELAWSSGAPWPAWPAGRILIRQAGSGDLAGGSGTSCLACRSQTRYLRFFAGVPASVAMLRILAGQRQVADALVATRNGVVIGHAMAVDTAGPPVRGGTEIGVVVADAWQGRVWARGWYAHWPPGPGPAGPPPW